MKEITADKQVRKILVGLKDPRIRDWLSTECEYLISLAFNAFMDKFHKGFLDENWKEQVC